METVIQMIIEGYEAATGERVDRNSIHCHIHQKHFKVITLWQPWATLLVYGIKKDETRPKSTSWVISNNFISGEKGHYLIHAAQMWTQELKRICLQEPFKTPLQKLGFIRWDNHTSKYIVDLPLGQIIGAVDFEKCCKIHNDTSHPFQPAPYYFEGIKPSYVGYPEIKLGDYTDGRYVWKGKNHRVLAEPIPYKNGQGYYLDFKGDKSKLIFK
jgi:hypothetical protein